MSKGNLVILHARYLILILILFGIFFVLIYSFTIIPFTKLALSFKDIITISVKSLKPITFYTLYLSLILSLCFHVFLIYNSQKKQNRLVLFIPVLPTTLMIFLFLFFVKPTTKSLDPYNIKDARFFFISNCFFTYENKTFIFETINEDEIINAVIITDNDLQSYPLCKVKFTKNDLILRCYQKSILTKTLSISKRLLKKSYVHHKIVANEVIDEVKLSLNLFIFSKNIGANLLYWFAISLLILAILTSLKITHFKLLNFIYYIVLTYLFFLLNRKIFELFYKTATYFMFNQLFLDYFLGIFIVALSCLIIFARLLIKKLFIMEH